jgi:hypothetical protein
MALPNPYTSAIGPIISGRDVERAALAMLRKWFSTYLAEAERQTGRVVGSLQRPRAWATSADFETWPEDQLPRVLLVSPGLTEAPEADGAGNYRVRFALGVAAIVSAKTLDDTADLAKLYCAVLRTCLVQHQSLEGFAAGVVWLDENYDDLPSIDTRSLGAGQAVFTVEVHGFARKWNGPAFPDVDVPEEPTDPIPEDAIATDVAVEIHNEGVQS